MWKYVRFNKVNFSAFYFANLWLCFTGYFVLKDPIKNFGSSLQNLLIKDLNVESSPATAYYWSLVFAYFLVICLTMVFVMKPLNIHIPDNKVDAWETAITFILVTGFFLYSFHKIFSIGMPEIFPGWLVKLIMGSNAYYIENFKSVEGPSMIWSNVSDILWNFGPLAFMWYRAKTGGGASN